MTNSPLDIVLGNILGAEHTRPDQKAVSFRIDFNNYVKLSCFAKVLPLKVLAEINC